MTPRSVIGTTDRRHGERLRIGIIAPPGVPVPPPAYGGTELVIDVLARGLAARGHYVQLFASGDSKCPVPVRSVFPRAVGTTAPATYELHHLEKAYEAFVGRVDLIHDHSFFGPLFAHATHCETPVVTTIHGLIAPDMEGAYESLSRSVSVVAISMNQRTSAPRVRVESVIPHGIDVATYPFSDAPDDYVLFLGRMHPDKGARRAVLAARAAGVPIRLAAKMWEPLERRYFEDQVEPLLRPDAVYVGEVGIGEKRALLRGARALLNPIRWREPFGLVMVEALSCGTPVISFGEGSAPEIVRHGVNGFLVEDEADMVAAIAKIDTIDRADCRRDAIERFDARRMVLAYEQLFVRVSSGASELRARPALRVNAGGLVPLAVA